MQSIKTLFVEWNEKHFQGKLSNVSLSFYNRRSNTKGFFRRRFGMREIAINVHAGFPFAPRTEADHQHTLLHEMVHAYLAACNLPCGHTPLFKRMLKDLTEKEFGFRPSTNVRFVVNMNGATLNGTPAPTKQVPIATLVPTLPTVQTGIRYKVISNGMIGTLIRESVAYGRKMVTIKVEGALFPFTTELSNVTMI